jgi:hypothetical protein
MMATVVSLETSCMTNSPTGCGSSPTASGIRDLAPRDPDGRLIGSRDTPKSCQSSPAIPVNLRCISTTTIVVPGSFTSGTNHFANAGHPADDAVTAAYEQHYGGLMDDVSRKLAELAPEDADAGEVARQIARVVDTPKGKRPFRVYVDPSDDGAEDVFRVGDRVRQWFYQRIGYSDLLRVSSSATPTSSD